MKNDRFAFLSPLWGT